MDGPRLIDQLRLAIRRRHYSPRTEKAYVHWCLGYIRYHGRRHPRELTAHHVTAWLNHLANDRRVAASTQNQALSAVLFLYKHVLAIDLPWLDGIDRARRPARLPVVLTRQEVRAVLAGLQGATWLAASLLYGSGLRVLECVTLRVKDLDFPYRQITVRDGKGQKDRRTMLPDELVKPLESHLANVKTLHERDLAAGFGHAPLPCALARKYLNADREWGWQFVFPSTTRSRDQTTGVTHRWYMSPKTLQDAVKHAVRRAGLTKPASCHTFRHCFATHLLESGYDILPAAVPGRGPIHRSSWLTSSAPRFDERIRQYCSHARLINGRTTRPEDLSAFPPRSRFPQPARRRGHLTACGGSAHIRMRHGSRSPRRAGIRPLGTDHESPLTVSAGQAGLA